MTQARKIRSTAVKVGRYDTDGNTRGVTVSGDYAYVGNGDNGLVVVDVSDPTEQRSTQEGTTPAWHGVRAAVTMAYRMGVT